jgi:galactose mutarotase-like enzyme
LRASPDPIHVFSDHCGGFAVVGLRSDAAEVRVMPQLGAKIISLLDRRSTREWLWRPENARPFQNRPGDPFETSTMTGADECLPSVAPCVIDGQQIPDHGEVWQRPWELDSESLNANQICTRIQLTGLPLRFERLISLAGERSAIVRLAYRLTNLSDEPQRFLWSFHPLMQIQPGDELIVPASKVKVEATTLPDMHKGDIIPWPNPRADVELHRLSLGAQPAYLKVFAQDLADGDVRIVNRQSGDQLTFRFDRRELPALGIWLTRGGWNGYHHFAIEPTHAPFDSLADAADAGACPMLKSRETISWTVELELGCAG